MSDDNSKQNEWLKLTPDIAHIDPFAGLIDLDQQPAKQIRYGFKIVNLNFILDSSIPTEIITKYTIHPIPKTPGWIRGLINHRGNLVPVFDLYKYFKIEKPDIDQPLILFDSNEHMVGIFTDAYPIALELESLTPSPYTSLDQFPDLMKNHISDSYNVDDNQWHELDLRKFLHLVTRDYSKDTLEKT